jgi:hypothetical protein
LLRFRARGGCGTALAFAPVCAAEAPQERQHKESMMASTKAAIAAVGVAMMIGGLIGDAEAASVRVRCEKRATRSKISVDGNNLVPGTYTARVTSGGAQKVSDAAPTVGDEVEFDFDSNRADIADGATPIPKNFIKGSVRGELLDAGGDVVASQTVSCRVR